VTGARPEARLCCVFGGNPLMPVVHGGLFIRRPHVSPEAHLLRGGRPALDHDAERSGGYGERECGHGTSPHKSGKSHDSLPLG
jgi:hypothetical protein